MEAYGEEYEPPPPRQENSHPSHFQEPIAVPTQQSPLQGFLFQQSTAQSASTFNSEPAHTISTFSGQNLPTSILTDHPLSKQKISSNPSTILNLPIFRPQTQTLTSILRQVRNPRPQTSLIISTTTTEKPKKYSGVPTAEELKGALLFQQENQPQILIVDRRTKKKNRNNHGIVL